ncbi:glycoside hydrolase family 16 protein [Marinimicrobium agarilyticum]|uniref:glycoside hydrolase family 16 protein n=1 Tax=Marinimicrobium agarilyticum TaxID=306546 RepID=UPI000568CFB0|nr:family 16 glycosylhydrolase [Marinimicrobium agarilyticum]
MRNKTVDAIRKVSLIVVASGVCAYSNASDDIDLSQWTLTWNDEFDYENDELDKKWISQNGPTENQWVLSSRWRDNAVVKDGVLYLLSKKENRGGQGWTTGNVWTKETFGFGYYEARMKYAGAYGTNNSFWLWPKQGVSEGDKACEIDINEGHYPNIINTNVHNWTDTYTLPSGRVTHDDDQLHHTLNGSPEHAVELRRPVYTKKVRLTSNNPASIHVSEFRVIAAESGEGYKAGDNLAVLNQASIDTNGIFDELPSKQVYAIDGKENTRWVSKKHGPKWLELSWDKEVPVKALELRNGWLQEFGESKGEYRNLISDYSLEYHDGSKWVRVAQYHAKKVADYSEEWHRYGLEWDEDYFRFYLDGDLFYEMRNDVCFSETTILLSLAILKADIAGPVTDAIDGTSMKIDWVRYYTKDQ